MLQVTAAIIVKDNMVLLAQRGPLDKLAGKWEFPGGKLEAGETPENCLIREIAEELNLQIRPTHHLLDHIYHYETGAIELVCYLGEITGGELKLNVHSAVRWVAPSQLLEFDLAPADVAVAQAVQKSFPIQQLPAK